MAISHSSIRSVLIEVESLNRAFSNNYHCEFSNLEPSIQPLFTFSVESVQFSSSHLNLGSENPFQTMFLKSLKNPSIPDKVTLKIREFQDYSVLNFLSSWYNRIFDIEKRCFNKNIKNEKKKLSIYVVMYDKNLKKSSDVELYSMNVLPLGIPSLPSYSYESKTYITLSVDFLITDNFSVKLQSDTRKEYTWL